MITDPLTQKEYEFVESVTKLRHPQGPLRVWRKQFTIEASYNNNDLCALFNALYIDDVSISEIARQLAAVDRVTAVEVLNNEGDGIVFYREW